MDRLEERWRDAVGPRRYAAFRGVLDELSAGTDRFGRAVAARIALRAWPPPPPSSTPSSPSASAAGFVFPCGEIYGGTRSAWDYGPLGVELKENIKRQWWRSMVTAREDVVGLDSSIILPRQTWVASGHVGEFTDPLTECQSCHKRFRVDHLQEAVADRRRRRARRSTPTRSRSPTSPAPTAAPAASGPSRATST